MTNTDTLAVPSDGELELDPSIRLTAASNITLGARISGVPVVYKPKSGERPLHDFPAGTLADREIAAHRVARTGGWDVIPATELRDGPLGPGSAQRWVEHSEASAVGDEALQLVSPTQVPAGWIPVVAAETEDGEQVLVVHPDDPALRSIAVLDEVLNNADRKASHLLRAPDGRWWAIDNGLSLHAEDKLRTVLWGWAGDPYSDEDLSRLRALHSVLEGADDGSGAGALAELLTSELLTCEEVDALGARVESMLARGTHTEIAVDRYPLPWPLW